MLFTAIWISLRIKLFFTKALLYSLWVSLLNGLEYGIWNGKVLLSKLVLLCKMYLTHVYHSKICTSMHLLIRPLMSNHVPTWVNIIIINLILFDEQILFLCIQITPMAQCALQFNCGSYMTIAICHDYNIK